MTHPHLGTTSGAAASLRRHGAFPSQDMELH